jgi:hypothetical protein
MRKLRGQRWRHGRSGARHRKRRSSTRDWIALAEQAERIDREKLPLRLRVESLPWDDRRQWRSGRHAPFRKRANIWPRSGRPVDLGEQSIDLRKNFLRRRWMRGSSPRMTYWRRVAGLTEAKSRNVTPARLARDGYARGAAPRCRFAPFELHLFYSSAGGPARESPNHSTREEKGHAQRAAGSIVMACVARDCGTLSEYSSSMRFSSRAQRTNRLTCLRRILRGLA